MIYGSNEEGEAALHLTPEEHARFKNGQTVEKITGCAKGYFCIEVKMYPVPNPFEDSDGNSET